MIWEPVSQVAQGEAHARDTILAQSLDSLPWPLVCQIRPLQGSTRMQRRRAPRLLDAIGGRTVGPSRLGWRAPSEQGLRRQRLQVGPGPLSRKSRGRAMPPLLSCGATSCLVASGGRLRCNCQHSSRRDPVSTCHLLQHAVDHLARRGLEDPPDILFRERVALRGCVSSATGRRTRTGGPAS